MQQVSRHSYSRPPQCEGYLHHVKRTWAWGSNGSSHLLAAGVEARYTACVVLTLGSSHLCWPPGDSSAGTTPLDPSEMESRGALMQMLPPLQGLAAQGRAAGRMWGGNADALVVGCVSCVSQ